MEVHNCPNLPQSKLDRLAMRTLLLERLSRICTWFWKLVWKKTSLRSWAKVTTIMINLRLTLQTSAITKKKNNFYKKTFQRKKDRPFAPCPTYARVMIWKRQCRVVPYKILFYSVKLRCRHLYLRKNHIQWPLSHNQQ